MLFERLREDIATVMEKDPAARSRLEVLLCYPGVHALFIHRIARGFWRAGLVLPARWLSHLARFLTGIEVHPGASVGSGWRPRPSDGQRLGLLRGRGGLRGL